MKQPPAFTDEQRAYFRECAAQRQRVNTTCAVCGTPLENVVLKRRYCGATCRKRAQLQRSRAQPTPSKGAPVPAMGTAATTPIGQGARVVLRRSLPDVPADALGRVVELDGKHALVRFDHYPPRRVAVAWLQAAPSE
jgi:hypothetical protein